ncbi:sensor domain-containing diguanylate cyclase [Psychromonas antarctica]|uniref:sensor domain-containing diguanylate cyclase n=1 Tax=Psychromonas antarctica TaxID=67573 RepID=UPI001EE89800|nr:sensor domain-containing diguanylate cyclase [Psychromonas antarctica]MCG6200187.1 diguanylate cyclase [Psychromonas antarctica]
MYKTYPHKTVKKSDMTLNSILDLIAEGIWDWDGNTGHVTRSPGWYRMLGYQLGSFKEDVFTWENIIHPEDYDHVMAHFDSYLTAKIDNYQIEYRCKKADGSYLWIVDHGNIIQYNTDGSPARMIGVHHDIDEQKKAQLALIEQNLLLKNGNLTLGKIVDIKTKELENKNRQLEKKITEIEIISNRDPLTKIANRHKFENVLCREISRANRYQHPLSLAIFDIDLFKHINDQYGHKTGDLLLCAISQLVSDNIRKLDLVARWGGDEFVLIFPEITHEKAYLICEKLRILISQSKVSDDLSATCSFGVSEYRYGDTLDTLFQRVDKLLFVSKENGRNRVHSESEAL